MYGTITRSIPKGAETLVSDFAQFIIEEQHYTCSSPTAGGCFPERINMGAPPAHRRCCRRASPIIFALQINLCYRWFIRHERILEFE